MKSRIFVTFLVGLIFCATHLCAALRAYVSNSGSNSLSIIDVSTNTVTGTIPVGFFPTDIDPSPDGTFIYVPLFSDNLVYAINTSTNTLENSVSLAPGSKPISVAVAPNGLAYITNFSNATISLINPQYMGIIATFPIGAIFPINMTISNSGNRGYIINALGPKNVKILDLNTNTVIATVNSGQQSLGIAITPDDSKVYVTNSLQSTVSVISTATNTVIATIALAANSAPRGIEISPSGSFAYAVNQGSASVAVINTSTNTVTTIIPLTANSDPYNIAITPDGLFAYVTQTLNNTVAVIDLTSNTMIGTITVGILPYDVTIVNVP